MKKLDDRVREALQAAKDNDYDMSDYNDEELAGDLLAYEADVEEETFEDVLASVKKVRKDVK
jgi:phage shock protein A